MTLYLLPNTLFEDQDKKLYLGQSVFDAVSSLDGLFAESERAGRRYLSHFQTKVPLQQMSLVLVNEHTKHADWGPTLHEIKKTNAVWGFVSDCGLPCVADPGEDLVERAISLGITIRALTGPSSIIAALLLSGMHADRFCFRGYLSRDALIRQKEILELDTRIEKFRETQILIEAPYRNRELFAHLVQVLQPHRKLVVCANLSRENEVVLRRTVSQWRQSCDYVCEKVPTIFVIGT